MLENIKFSKKTMLIVIINCLLLLLFVLQYTEAYVIENMFIWIGVLLMLEELLRLHSYFFPKKIRQRDKKQKIAVVVTDALILLLYIYIIIGAKYPSIGRESLFGKYVFFIILPIVGIRLLIGSTIDNESSAKL